MYSPERPNAPWPCTRFVLARVLVSGRLGLVAMAVSVIAFVELASNVGFDLSLIHATPTRNLDTAGTLR